MAFEGLSEKISMAFKRLKSKGKLSEKDITDAMREIRLALLEADVNYKVAKEFTDKITKRAIGEDVMKSLTPSQMVIKIVNEELTDLMGGHGGELDFSGNMPHVFMFCGLQGSGKTTHVAKLAYKLKKMGRRPLVVACDIYRPAAIDQLEIMAKKAEVPVFKLDSKDAVKISKKALNHAKDHGNDVVIIDTAGRLHVDEKLMQELYDIKKAVSPVEILLTIDAMIGQDAVNVAKAFDEKLDITGVVLTKLDGDSRGGAALSVKQVTGKPIKFVGTGEKIEDLEQFHPDRMASRILGMGDILTLIEEAEQKIDLENAEKVSKNLLKEKFDFNDFLDQIKSIKKMGSFKSLLSKMPGVPKEVLNSNVDGDKELKKVEAIIYSMTPEERSKPELLAASRKRRIALGAGVKVEDINKVVKGFSSTQKMMKSFKGNKRGIFSAMSGLKGIKR